MLGRYQQFLYGLLYGLLLALFVGGALLVVSRRPPGQPVQLKDPPTPVPLRVHVTGGVAMPGVYALPPGSIWQDAIRAAGGSTALADLSHINLAQLLNDGDQVWVPELTPTRPPPTPLPPTPTLAPTQTVGPGTPSPTPPPTATPAPASATSGSANPGGKVNLNTASAAELETLPRIGPTIAQRIIDYRTANGPFQAIEDIMRVKGIGPATFEQIKDQITVGP